MVAGKVAPPSRVTVSDIDRGRVARLCRRLKVKAAPPGRPLRGGEGVVLLCVKPYQAADVCRAVAAEPSVKLVISVATPPYKCPPAPFETAMMIHWFLRRQGIRKDSEIIVTIPEPAHRITAMIGICRAGHMSSLSQ